MTKIRGILVAALVLGLAGAASAASKAPALTAAGRTIAGPGAVSVDFGGSQTVFSYGPSRDACVTVANTGKQDVTVNITGTGSPSFTVSAGETGSGCADNTTAIAIACNQSQGTCSAQWRVDTN